MRIGWRRMTFLVPMRGMRRISDSSCRGVQAWGVEMGRDKNPEDQGMILNIEAMIEGIDQRTNGEGARAPNLHQHPTLHTTKEDTDRGRMPKEISGETGPSRKQGRTRTGGRAPGKKHLSLKGQRSVFDAEKKATIN